MNGDDEAEEEQLASDEQLNHWVGRFAGYRQAPTREVLCGWLARFDEADRPIAHRVLDTVRVVTELEIHQGYRAALDGLPGWSKGEDRAGRWFFVGVGGAGESGPAMLRMFREANGLTANRWQNFFKMPRELPTLRLTAFDHVVFVDDFAGTGRQMVNYWPLMQELVASEATCYLLLTAITGQAEQHIEAHTDLLVHPSIRLDAAANIFSPECGIFTVNEMSALDRYGQIAWAAHPRGYGECGLTLVLSHKTPNNSIPILHANHNGWVGPFPRNLLAA